MPVTTTLPIMRRDSYDNSIISTHARCPRKMFYAYALNRGHSGYNPTLTWGSLYHNFREQINKQYIANDGDVPPEFAYTVIAELVDKWEEPELGHSRDWMTKQRLNQTLLVGWEHFLNERQIMNRKILFAEQPFTLALPSGRLFGGRIDEILEWNGRLWMRDYKTTARMGRTYGRAFDPNNQMTGYTWASRQLSGRPVAGVIIQTVYNTKTQGPEIHEHLTTRDDAAIDQWIETIEAELDEIDSHFETMRFPMRTESCDDYGGCMFREACQIGAWPGIDRWLEGNTIESIWDYNNPEGEEGRPD